MRAEKKVVNIAAGWNVAFMADADAVIAAIVRDWAVGKSPCDSVRYNLSPTNLE